MGIMFYHITLDVNGRRKKILIRKRIFWKLQGKSEININIKKVVLEYVTEWECKNKENDEKDFYSFNIYFY